MLNDRFAYMWGLFGEHVWTYSIWCNRVSEPYYVATFLAKASPTQVGFYVRDLGDRHDLCADPHMVSLNWGTPKILLVYHDFPHQNC